MNMRRAGRHRPESIKIKDDPRRDWFHIEEVDSLIQGQRATFRCVPRDCRLGAPWKAAGALRSTAWRKLKARVRGFARPQAAWLCKSRRRFMERGKTDRYVGRRREEERGMSKEEEREQGRCA